MLNSQIQILIQSSKLLSSQKKEQFLSFLAKMTEGQKKILLKNLENLKIAEENLNTLNSVELEEGVALYKVAIGHFYQKASKKARNISEKINSQSENIEITLLDSQLQSIN